ncbi:hypothetical protein ACLFMI_24715 [Pseudonocardia nantongensis]
MDERFDVVVVGGGNSYYTAGAVRIAHDGLRRSPTCSIPTSGT